LFRDIANPGGSFLLFHALYSFVSLIKKLLNEII